MILPQIRDYITIQTQEPIVSNSISCISIYKGYDKNVISYNKKDHFTITTTVPYIIVPPPKSPLIYSEILNMTIHNNDTVVHNFIIFWKSANDTLPFFSFSLKKEETCIYADNKFTIYNESGVVVSMNENDTTWISLVTGYKTGTVPTLLTTITDGDVYSYTYSTDTSDIIYYRLVPSGSLEDAFYTTFSLGVLSEMIAHKKLTIIN